MPKARRRTSLLAGAISLFVGVVVAVPALAEQGTAGIPLPPPPTAGSGDKGGDGGSTAGYPNASPGQAENLFTNNFAATVDSLASEPPDLSGQHPDFLDNHTAVVSPDGTQTAPSASDIESVLAKDQHDVSAAQSDLNDLLGQQGDGGPNSPQLVSSALPLRTDDGDGQAPVDLSLDQQGSGYAPDNPLVDLKLPENLNNDVTLGNDGVKVDVGATDSATADPIDGGESLFYADAAPATDVVLAPISTGLESFYELRAPESPDHFEMNFNLPDGAQLEQGPGGGAQITSAGGDTLGVVYPPAATDAAGNQVDVTISVNGDSLELHVPHAGPGISYPISVDPVVDLYTWSTNGQGIFADWVANQTTGSPYQLRRTCKENVDCTSGTTGPTGLYSLAPANQAIAQNAAATWQYQVPHYPWTTSYVSVANLGPMYFNPRTDTNANPFMFAGIYPDASGNGYVDTQAQTTGAGNLYWQLNAGSATTAKQVAFGLWSWTARSPSAWRDAYDGGAAIWIGDKESPTLTDVTHSGISIGQADWSVSNWVDSASPSVSVTAQDNGVGIKSLMVPRADGSLRTVSEGCDGTSASPCPERPDSVTATYDTSQMPNGLNITGVLAQDALDKAASRTFVVRVDHSAPTIDLSGTLDDFADQPLTESAYGLHVSASDGSNSPSGTPSSGVASIEVRIDGHRVDYVEQNCPGSSCSMGRTWILHPSDYSDGSHALAVIVKDQLGHTRNQQLTLNIDRRNNITHVWEYDSWPALPLDPVTADSESWIQSDMQAVRTVEGDTTNTRDLLPCDADHPGGALCEDVRQLDPEGDGPTSFLNYRSVRVDDPDLPQIGADFSPQDPGTDPAGQGVLADVMADWQVPPPGHGSQYDVYTRSDDPNESGLDFRTFVDHATGLPIKRQIIDTGDVVATNFWSYAASRLDSTDKPADFFAPSEPPGNGDREFADERANEPIGPQRDAETGQMFQPYYLGPHPVISGVAYCLTSTDIVQMSFDPGTITTDPNVLDEPAGAPETWVEANYRQVPSAAACNPGAGSAPTPELTVTSEASASGDASQLTHAYSDIGQAVEQDPADDQTEYGGLRPIQIGPITTSEYFVAQNGGDSSSLMRANNDTTITIDGPIDKAAADGLSTLLTTR